MKKKVLTIVAIVLVVALVAGGITAYCVLPHSLNYDIKSIESVGTEVEIVNKDVDSVTVKKDGEFKVLMFTDTHLDGKNETSYVTVENLVRNIQDEKPDLVIFGGDNVTSALNKKRTEQFAQIFEKLGVYWAGVLGNHEGDNGFSLSREEMVDLFSSYEHCLMLKGPDDIWGNGNYFINILNSDDSLKKTFYFLDSGSDASEEYIEKYNVTDTDRHLYDGPKETQVEWYKNKVAENTAKYGESESVLVTHIPLFQMREMAENTEYLYGEKREGVCSTCFEIGLFDAIKECGSTKYVFFGHDHVNNFALELDGIVLSYIEASGYGSYNMKSKFDAEEKDWLQGYTRLIINNDGSFSNEQFRNCEVSK